VADVVSLTGASSLIGQTEGTLYADFNFTANSTGRRLFGVSNGTASVRFAFTVNSSNFIGLVVNGSANLIPTGTLATGRYKCVATYTNAVVKFFVNGVKIGELALDGSGAYTDVDLGHTELNASQLNDRVLACALFPTAISESQSIALSTL
jgi:hypothetical protein